MDAFDAIGLLLPALEKVGDKVVGYDDRIRKKFNRALQTALKGSDEFYIRNVEIHMPELVGLIVLVMDEPSSINTILLPNYISRDEFRRFYAETQKDKDLSQVLKDEWNQFKAKDTNNQVKIILDLIVRLNDEKKEDRTIWRSFQTAIEKLIKLIGEMQDEKNNGESVKAQSLDDCLKKKLEEKRKHHPSFRLMDIDKKLFPNGIVTFDTEARDSNNDQKKVKEIVAESWERGETNHLMIEGEGGIGKTVTLLSLPDNFAPHPVPAIYIPLHELKEETNTIEKYIKNRVLDTKEQYDLLRDIVNKPWNEGPHLLLLLDGFNEIAVEHRESISEDIEQWSEKPGLQIITSSRFDIHQYVALRSSFSKIELQPLSEETVSEYLVIHKMGVPENPAIIKLITIPLLLTLYIKAEAIRNDRPSPFAKFKETKNAGLLIWNYLQCELWRFKNKKEEAKASILAMEFIAPYIAWTMQQHTEFVLDESTFFDRIDEAYHLLNSHVEAHGQLPDHIKTTLRQSPGLSSIEHIGDLLKEHLCLFINNEGEYRLMHQQFRDALAAMHLINLSYLSSNSLPQEWNTPIDHYVMQFVADLISADLISEEEATKLWEQNRKTTPAVDDATRNQLRLQGLLHNNDYSHLDFSGLDLSDISLFSYRYSKAIIQLPTQQARMTNVKISKKTFSPEGHKDWVLAVAVTPDGKRIVSGSRDCTIRVWDLVSGAAIGEPIEVHKKWVTAIAVTPEGDIVSGSDDGTIHVWGWDLDSWAERRTIYGHKDRVTSIVVTANGKSIVSGSDDGTIRVWDMVSGAEIRALCGHKDKVTAVAATANGGGIVSGSNDHTICLWDLESGEAIKKNIKGHEGWVNAIAVTSNGECIVSGSVDCTIRVWERATGAAVLPPIEGHQYSVTAISVTLDGKRIVSGSWDSTIRVWDLKTGAAIGKPIEGHKGSVSAVAVTPDGKRIVSGSWDQTIRVWELATGAAIVKPVEEGHKKLVQTVVVTADEKLIVSSSGDCIIRVWDPETGMAIGKPIESHQSTVTAVAVTPDGKCIVSGSSDHTIQVWDIKTGAAIGAPIEGHEDRVTAVAVTPDGEYIVSGSRDGSICVWDIVTGKAKKKPIKWHNNYVTVLAVTPDGKHIVGRSWGGTIRVWDKETGKAIVKPVERWSDNKVTEVAVTLDGRRIIGRSWDHFIRVWDMGTGEAIENYIDGHKLWENAVVLISNMKRIVCNDDTISITDIETREVKKIKIHPLSFVGLDFSLADIADPELKEILRQNGAKV